jgi:hypothetical protein
MAAARFQVGDRVRVRARVTTAPVPAGTRGTIARVYSSLTDIYDVAFDGHVRLWMTPGHVLEYDTDDEAPADKRADFTK